MPELRLHSQNFIEWISFDKIPKDDYDWALRLSKLLYGMSYDNILTYQKSYIIGQLVQHNIHGRFSEFVMEKIVRAYAS